MYLIRGIHLREKAFIIRDPNEVEMLSKRSEFISKCGHIDKRLLIRVKDDSNDLIWGKFVFTVCFSCISYQIVLFLKVKTLTEDSLAWN